MGYLAECSSLTGPENFGLHILPEKTDVDGLGKTAGELGNLNLEGTIFSGSLHYVTGYTGFHGTDPEQQEGYFLPFGFSMPDGYGKAHMMVKGGSGVSVEPTAQNVVFLGKAAEEAKKKSLVITLNQIDEGNPDNIQSAVAEYSLERLVLEPQQKKSSRKKE